MTTARLFSILGSVIVMIALSQAVTPPPSEAHVRISTDLSWSEDVRPILRRYCMPCHNPKGSAPSYVDLTTYGTDSKPGARAWAAAIEEEILTGRMPPWPADPRYDHFSNTRKMSQREIDIVIGWIQGGGPQGPRRNLEAPPEFIDEWILGQPDLVLSADPYTLAEGAQNGDWTRTFEVDIEEDRWITAYEFLPEHAGTVYRMEAWILSPSNAQDAGLEVEVQVPYDPFRDEDEEEPTRVRTASGQRHFLGQWVRGDDPVLLPDGAGKLLRKGSSIELAVFYQRRPNDGSAELLDNSRLGLSFAQSEDEVELWMESVNLGSDLRLRGKKGARPQVASITLEENVRLVGLNPTLGDRLDELEVAIVFPDERRRTLLLYEDYDPTFPASYQFLEQIDAPRGSRLEMKGTFALEGKAAIEQDYRVAVDYVLDDHLVLPEIIEVRPRPSQGSGMIARIAGVAGAPGAPTGSPDVPPPPPNANDPNAAAHMDHSPLHGGQFFMAPNFYHHLEGALPKEGEFRLYVYDDFKLPVDPRNFSGDVVFERFNEETEEWEETAFPLTAVAGTDYLVSQITPDLPAEFFASLWLAGEKTRFDFYFEETTKEPPASARRAAARNAIAAAGHSHERPPLYIPPDRSALVAVMLDRRDRVRSQIENGEWLTLYVPAFDARDLAEALLEQLDDVPARSRGEVRQAVARILQSSAELDRAGDLADRARAQRAYERFNENVRTIESLLKPRG